MAALRQREPRVEAPGFLAYLRRLYCCACQAPPPVQAAHIRMGCLARGERSAGMGAKPSDRRAVPLCRVCHLDGPEAQHRGSEAEFWRRAGIDPFAVAAALYAEYERVKPRKRGVDSGRGSQASRPRRAKASGPKRKWPSTQIRSANRWPAKGSRKIREM
jgi:hypothetical protein